MMRRLLASGFLILSIVSFSIAPGLAESEKPHEEREGGIVGTGIVGMITGLGSIRVNGQRIVFPDDLMTASELGDRPAGDLLPGETVAVEAVLAGNEWAALHIRHYLPIIGPVSLAVDGSPTVLGSAIETGPDTELVGFDGGTFEAGQWVAVNGLWRGGTVVATRVDRIGHRPEAVVVGTYRPDPDGGGFLVGGTRVLGLDIQHAEPGDLLTVRGIEVQGNLRASSIVRGLFVGRIETLLMEGYLSQPDPSGVYTIYGSGVSASLGDRDMPISPDRGLYCALAADAPSIAELTTLPEREAERQALLDSRGSDLALRCR